MSQEKVLIIEDEENERTGLAELISAWGYRTDTAQDGRRSQVKMQAMKAKIEDTILNSRCVLAAGNNFLVLWAGDQSGAATPVNASVNLSELEQIGRAHV